MKNLANLKDWLSDHSYFGTIFAMKTTEMGFFSSLE